MTVEPPRVPSHKNVILAIALTGVRISVLDPIVVGIALLTITGAFKVDITASQWTITVYLLTLTSFLLFFGRVGESSGRAVLFIAGTSVFTLSSLIKTGDERYYSLNYGQQDPKLYTCIRERTKRRGFDLVNATIIDGWAESKRKSL